MGEWRGTPLTGPDCEIPIKNQMPKVFDFWYQILNLELYRR